MIEEARNNDVTITKVSAREYSYGIFMTLIVGHLSQTYDIWLLGQGFIGPEDVITPYADILYNTAMTNRSQYFYYLAITSRTSIHTSGISIFSRSTKSLKGYFLIL